MSGCIFVSKRSRTGEAIDKANQKSSDEANHKSSDTENQKSGNGENQKSSPRESQKPGDKANQKSSDEANHKSSDAENQKSRESQKPGDSENQKSSTIENQKSSDKTNKKLGDGFSILATDTVPDDNWPEKVAVSCDMNVVNFRLKFEDLQSQYRPHYAAFENMSINLNGDISSGIFGSVSRKKQFLRKRRGFCECCDVEYDNLHTHLHSYQHRMFALTKSNYETLANMIDEVNLSSLFCANLLDISSDLTLQSREEATCNKTVGAISISPSLKHADYCDTSENEVHIIFC